MVDLGWSRLYGIVLTGLGLLHLGLGFIHANIFPFKKENKEEQLDSIGLGL